MSALWRGGQSCLLSLTGKRLLLLLFLSPGSKDDLNAAARTLVQRDRPQTYAAVVALNGCLAFRGEGAGQIMNLYGRQMTPWALVETVVHVHSSHACGRLAGESPGRHAVYSARYLPASPLCGSMRIRW